jgi:rhodanese-related sulfurtransferase
VIPFFIKKIDFERFKRKFATLFSVNGSRDAIFTKKSYKMKYLSILVLLFLGLNFATCQNQKVAPAAFKNLTSADFKEKAAHPGQTLLLDVRSPEEYAAGHLDGAQNINVNSPDFKEKVANLDKKKTILVYCAAGGRSAKASQMLVDMGYNAVCNLQKGMSDWKASGFEVKQ